MFAYMCCAVSELPVYCLLPTVCTILLLIVHPLDRISLMSLLLLLLSAIMSHILALISHPIPCTRCPSEDVPPHGSDGQTHRREHEGDFTSSCLLHSHCSVSFTDYVVHPPLKLKMLSNVPSFSFYLSY